MASLTERLAFVLDRPRDAQVRDRASLHLLDWLGCAFGGTRSEAGRAVLEWARRTGSTGPFATIGAGHRDRATAVLVNGALGNILEMDDVHRTAILHPAPVVVPAAIAAAHDARATGAALLDALVVGYEAMIRVGRSFGPGHYRFWHNTSTAGPFGAAAAVGSLAGLTPAAMAHALGNAGTQSAGLWQTRHDGSMAKQLHTARAAHAGMVAAQLAAVGFTGPRMILEGPQGLYAATCPDAMPERVMEDAHREWLICDTSFKPWPACRHAHAAIDAALGLRSHFACSDVASVRVLAYEDAIGFCDRPEPRTVQEAKFSLQHAVAVALARGRPALEDFEPDAIADPLVSLLRARVQVAHDPALTEAYPEHYGAAIVVALVDGRQLRFDVRDALGDPVKLLARDAIVEKASSLMTWAGVEPARRRAIVDAALALPGAADTSGLQAAVASAWN